LTRFQYNNAVRDLLGDETNPAAEFPPENEVDGYRTNAAANPVNPLLVERYLMVAESVAARAATEQLHTIAPCASGNESVCGQEFARAFAERAFRRPVTENELAPLVGSFERGHRQSYARGVELVVQTVLQSPQFLYRVETLKSATPETGAVQLGPYELASRLSFSLWGSVPDAELLTAAASGELGDAAGVERQARRMLTHARARDVVRDFTDQWLGLSRLSGAVREGSGLEPNVLSSALAESLTRFVESAYFGPELGFERLFASPTVWLDSTLSSLYGAAGENAEFEPQMLPEPRHGLLTQPALLALLSHSEQTAPVIRGAFVRERILCLPVPPPPPDVNAIPPDPDPNATTRERFRQHTEQAACASCHRLIDGIGFGFERYDQLGRYRALENDLPVDESGSVVDTGEAGLDGDFASAAELAARIGQSKLARDCLATHWFRYSFGRMEDEADACSLVQLKERFRAANGDLQELLVGLTQSDAFLYRPGLTETP
jgi:hypothetical protein